MKRTIGSTALLSLLLAACAGAGGGEAPWDADPDDTPDGKTSAPRGGNGGARGGGAHADAGEAGPGSPGGGGTTGAGGAAGSAGGGGAAGSGGAGGAAGGRDGTGGSPGGTDGGQGAGTKDAGALPDAAGATAKAVYEQTFDTLKLGSAWLNSCKWVKHTRVTAKCGVGGTNCLRIAQDPTNKEPSLFPLPPIKDRPPYPAGSTGVCHPYYTNTATDVVQDTQPIPATLEYSLNYDLYFEPGFDWARGGKLPGLSAKEWDSGCSIEGDGLSTDPGAARWSVRLMWRAGGTNELYVYDQDRVPGACGTRSPTSVTFTTGKWYAVTIYVKLNSTANARDGVAQLYLDGALLRDEQGLRLRGTESNDARISQIFFSTFFGGNEAKRLHCLAHPDDKTYCANKDPLATTTWVPKAVSYIDFDNVAVYPGLRVRTAAGK